jgi:membrane associated rhomboid family serine protease
MALTTTCYRHPDRVTGASCTRCGRPICPDCMTVAPVGHHCPECVREGRKSVRQVRAQTDAIVVKSLIAINVLVFLLQQGDRTGRSDITSRFAMLGYAVAHDGQIYRLFTAAFLHANVLHILFNMFALWIVGPALEAALGRVRFLTMYIVAALSGSVCSYFLTSSLVYGIGASGAVMGAFGAYFVVARARRVDSRQVVGLIVITLIFGFATPGIDNWAHIGGVVGGVAMAFLFTRTERLERSVRLSVQVAGTAVALLAIAVLTSARTSHRTTALHL